MAKVVLIGKDWKTRALLRAQLLEEGIEVLAFETPADALQAFSNHPSLVFADLAASDEPLIEVDQLAHWAKFIPVWILGSHALTSSTAMEGRGFERVFFRPVSIGDLTAEIKRRLSAASSNDC